MLLALVGCPADKGTPEGSTGADGSGDGDSSAGDPSTGDSTAGVTDGSGSSSSSGGEPPIVTSSSGDEPTGTTGEEWCAQVDALQLCDLDEPCPQTEVDSCQWEGCDDPAMQCMWPVLRDNIPARLRFTDNINECQPSGVWIVMGDAEHTLLRTVTEGLQEAPVTRCTISVAALSDCIDNPMQDQCFLPDHWVENCVPEDAPACPAP